MIGSKNSVVSIGILLPNCTNPFYAQLIQELHNRLREEGMEPMLYLSGQGISVPEKLKILGYDGIIPYENYPFPIDSVAQNIPLIAKKLVETLLRRIQGNSGLISEHIRVAPKLITAPKP